MKARAQLVRREARLARRAPEILCNRERHIERVLGTGGKRDQCSVAGILDPVVDVREGCKIRAENRRQGRLGSVLLGRRSLRVSDKVGEEEARDQRAARRMPQGFGHGKFTDGTCGMAAPSAKAGTRCAGRDVPFPNRLSKAWPNIAPAICRSAR